MVIIDDQFRAEPSMSKIESQELTLAILEALHANAEHMGSWSLSLPFERTRAQSQRIYDWAETPRILRKEGYWTKSPWLDAT